LDLPTRLPEVGEVLMSTDGIEIDDGRSTQAVIAVVYTDEDTVSSPLPRSNRSHEITGSKLGRPRSLSPSLVEMARPMMSNPALSARQVAEQLGVHRSTLYRSINSTK